MTVHVAFNESDFTRTINVALYSELERRLEIRDN